MPKQLKSRQKRSVKNLEWSKFIKEFNMVHNSTMFTSVGTVNVKTKDYDK